MPHNLIILGSTGSIGQQTLDVVRILSEVNVLVLTANKNIDVLEKQISEFKPKLVCVTDENKAKILRDRCTEKTVKIISGEDGLLEAAIYEKAGTLINALIGGVGLKPTVAAIKAGKKILLANKETLVMAGEIVTQLSRSNNVELIPIDSEHSAIFQCLQGSAGNVAKKIYLTASGGPFRLTPKEKLETVTAKEALKHPNWSMGAKITIDSATMMNKGLEIIEAKWLFDISEIEVLVHPQSIIHSMVEFDDGAVIAQLGAADMRHPILYALTYPKRIANHFPKLDFYKIKQLTFEKPQTNKFPCLNLARFALLQGGLFPAILNAANEIAVEAFLEGIIPFTKIPILIDKAINQSVISLNEKVTNLENILAADKWAREWAKNQLF